MKKILAMAASAIMISALWMPALAETVDSDYASMSDESFVYEYSVEPCATTEEATNEEALVVQGSEIVDNLVAANVGGETTAEADMGKTSPDTGVTVVAGIAGVAILAAGTVLFASKRG